MENQLKENNKIQNEVSVTYKLVGVRNLKNILDRRKQIGKVYYLKIGPVEHDYIFQHISSTHPINVRPPDKTIKKM